MAVILITGGTGLIGTALTRVLLADGHTVRHLSRNLAKSDGVVTFRWDVTGAWVDSAALNDVVHIVHLAGAGIADRRWTDARVHELIDSRAKAARLLLRVAREQGHFPKSFISAAGIGYYGAITTDQVFAEDDPPGTDTMGRISREWEAGVDEWMPFSRVVKLRTAVVLAHQGPLARLAAPARWGLAAPLGNGRQWMPWVHIDDVVRVYQQAIAATEMQGAYNVNAGEQPTNKEFMRAIAKALNRPFFLPAVPRLVLKLLLGEMANVVLEGSRTSNEKLIASGFRFRFNTLADALADLLAER
ncbi:MAG TPA: TIGR01777 family oxidoreductase [Flavobacteriales bacterium]|nr:TIGR01777 family oxidoreductase [Flavobacteriales bacterium]